MGRAGGRRHGRAVCAAPRTAPRPVGADPHHAATAVIRCHALADQAALFHQAQVAGERGGIDADQLGQRRHREAVLLGQRSQGGELRHGEIDLGHHGAIGLHAEPGGGMQAQHDAAILHQLAESGGIGRVAAFAGHAPQYPPLPALKTGGLANRPCDVYL
jgi:hypothetical protein